MISNQLKEITLLDHKDLYQVKSHHHNYVEIVYYISGNGEIVIDGKNHLFSDNTFSVTLPGFEHTEKSLSKTKLIYIGFSIDRDSDLSVLENGVFKCPHDVHILNLMKEILFAKSNGDFLGEEIISGYIYTLIRLVGCVIYKAHAQSRKMVEIKEYISNNIKEKLNAEIIAMKFSYDYDYLRKLFKQYYHISISDYILKVKLDCSLEMLKKTNKSIEEIAKELNFSSTSHYIQLFRKNFQITPKQFLLNYDKNATKIVN